MTATENREHRKNIPAYLCISVPRQQLQYGPLFEPMPLIVVLILSHRQDHRWIRGALGRGRMKRVIFELSMPSNNAWNGNWSGEGNDYTVARKMSDDKFEGLKPRYTYAFGDGWVAAVSLREAKPREKVSDRFCGYEWMVDSILRRGAITAER